MQTNSRGRHALSPVVRYLLATLVVVSLVTVATACGGNDDATPPPPTIIRADETPAADATATPSPTPESARGDYPSPGITPPADSGYPGQNVVPTIAAYPAS